MPAGVKRRLARIMHETPSRDCGDGRATGQPQGLGPEAYLFSTSQSATPEDTQLPARRDGAAPEAGWSAAQSACLRYAQSEKCEKGEKCKQFGHVLILSRFASFPACLAAGRACVLLRLCAFAEQTTLPRAIRSQQVARA